MIEIFMLTAPEKRYQKFTLFKPLKIISQFFNGEIYGEDPSSYGVEDP